MRVILTGYGRMGREIEKILVERGHTVVARIDPKDPQADDTTLSRDVLDRGDVVIEFSLPQAVVENTARYVEARKPVVIGTTGWEREREAVLTDFISSGTSIVWGNNFSIGANVFLRICSTAARFINNFSTYDAFLHEYHHNKKKDSPSGTAIIAAKRVLAELDSKSSVVTERLDRPPAPEELHVSSTRGGSVPGTHTLTFDSDADTIEVTHRARNRSGFAAGAVMAAEWLLENPGVYSADDYYDEISKEK